MQPRIDPQKQYLTHEVARHLRKSVRTVESWRRCRIHPILKWVRGADGRVRYAGADILRFLADGASLPPKRRRGAR